MSSGFRPVAAPFGASGVPAGGTYGGMARTRLSLAVTPMLGMSADPSRRGSMASETGPSWPGRFRSKRMACPAVLRPTLSFIWRKLTSRLPSIATISSPARIPASYAGEPARTEPMMAGCSSIPWP